MDEAPKVSLTKHRLTAGCGLSLTFIFDNPECRISSLSSQLTARERAEGRLKGAPSAYRGWLLGRLAAKEALAGLWKRPPSEVEVLKGPEGAPRAIPIGRRPSRAGRPEPGPGWVSISHTVGAAAALAAATPVGVDLERLDRPVNPRVWSWAFSPEEHELLREASGRLPGTVPSDSPPPGLALWCAKEAAAKAWGRGLLNHLHQVRVTGADWPEGRITVGWVGENVYGHRPAEVRLMVHEGYLAALAGVTLE